ncbi:uncharacterized protein [Notamacropus eugenii]|uniref:uncharacterized protein n=1 Tax=Notamacropus eugenii TaxID=9315 RepID=UPI003B67E1E5
MNGSRNSAPTVQPGLHLPLAPALRPAVVIATPRGGGIGGFKVPDSAQTKGSRTSPAPALLVTMSAASWTIDQVATRPAKDRRRSRELKSVSVSVGKARKSITKLSTSLRLTLKRERTASGKPPQGSAENPSLPAGEFPKFPVACAQATGPVRPCSSKLQRPSCRATLCTLRGSKLRRLASQPSRGLNGSRNSAPTVQPGLHLPLAPALHPEVAIATPRGSGIGGFKVPDPGQTKGSLSSPAPALPVTMITTTLGCSAWPSWPLQVSLPGSPGPKEANFSELL